MICPNCKHVMTEQKMETRIPGEYIKVNQCPECGGIWFDLYELCQLSEEEAIKLESINIQKVSTPVAINPNLVCPKDGTGLTRFNNESFPKSIHILSCGKCGGVWINKEDLKEYEEERELKKAENQKTTTSSTALEDFSNFLMQPVDSLSAMNTNLSDLHYEGAENPYDIGEAGESLVKAVPKEERAEIYERLAYDAAAANQRETRDVNFMISVVKGIFLLLRAIV